MQHGASTLPLDAFDAFPRVGACEIHLATDFQNMVYEHPQFPADLKAEMYAWLREHATEERKPKDTEEQFIYKARKKAIGPFKSRMWGIDAARRDAIGALARRALHAPDDAAEDQRHLRGGEQIREGAAGAPEPGLRDESGRGHHHRGRTQGGRTRRLVGNPFIRNGVGRNDFPEITLTGIPGVP